MLPAYDDNNIFAKILRGEAPCLKLYENDDALAFIDVMPRAPGHLLVIPRSRARNLFDIEPRALAALMPVVQKMARAAKAGLGADGVSVFQFNEAAGGQVVFHLHVHVIPRFNGDKLKAPGGPMADVAELEPIAAKIRAALTTV
jgi:histidine triad (HIT) family protein